MAASVFARFKWLAVLLRRSGPYLLLEILLPGGTLFALLLFFYERRQQRQGRAVMPWSIASLWRERAGERDGLEALAMLPAPVDATAHTGSCRC